MFKNKYSNIQNMHMGLRFVKGGLSELRQFLAPKSPSKS